LRVGALAQETPDGLDALTVRAVLARSLAKVGAAEEDWRVDVLLDEIGMDPAMAEQTFGALSGGWQRLTMIAGAARLEEPDILVLDEPTNHLDLATREALAMALNEFEGTVMLVSHDRALLRAVCDEFWLVTKGGVEPFDGDLDDYQQFLRDEARRMREQAAE
jgi:ATPase subunit of ABC transporter with duplicated ATPase domains